MPQRGRTDIYFHRAAAVNDIGPMHYLSAEGYIGPILLVTQADPSCRPHSAHATLTAVSESVSPVNRRRIDAVPTP